MKEILKLVFVLTLISAICAALLAVAYKVTEKPIAEAAIRKTKKAAADVLPLGAKPEIVEKDGTSYFVVKENGVLTAVALEGRSSKGYAGDIVLMVGLKADGTLIDYKILDCKETPGLGVKIGVAPFKTQFLNRTTADILGWKVKKDGGAIDAVTAATISSRAALGAISDAVKKFKSAQL